VERASSGGGGKLSGVDFFLSPVMRFLAGVLFFCGDLFSVTSGGVVERISRGSGNALQSKKVSNELVRREWGQAYSSDCTIAARGVMS